MTLLTFDAQTLENSFSIRPTSNILCCQNSCSIRPHVVCDNFRISRLIIFIKAILNQHMKIILFISCKIERTSYVFVKIIRLCPTSQLNLYLRSYNIQLTIDRINLVVSQIAYISQIDFNTFIVCLLS